MSDSQQKQFDGNPGDTVWFDQMYQDIRHLYVVLTPPERTSSKAIIVNVTSQRSGSDETVVLQPEDHPSIKHPSVVNYQAAYIARVEWLKKEIDQQIAWPDHPFEPAVLKRIQDGVTASPLIPREIRNYYLATMG